MADDGLNRGLTESQANPYLDVRHLRYFGDDDIRVIGMHDVTCFNGVDSALKIRHQLKFREEGEMLGINVANEFLNEIRDMDRDGVSDGPPYADFNGTNYRPYVINTAKEADIVCARDHKWKLVGDAIDRGVCDCNAQFYAIIAVYRLWKCTATNGLENLGVGAVMRVEERLFGKRDFWFNRYACERAKRARQFEHPQGPRGPFEHLLPSSLARDASETFRTPRSWPPLIEVTKATNNHCSMRALLSQFVPVVACGSNTTGAIALRPTFAFLYS